MLQFVLIHTNEDARRYHTKSFLQKTIDNPLILFRSSERTSPVVVALSSCREVSVYLVVVEEKNEFRARGSDLSDQAVFSFLRILSQKTVMMSILSELLVPTRCRGNSEGMNQ